MTASQLQILQHALGLDEYGRGKPYRNHFTGENADCRALVALGYMRESPRFPSALSGGDPVFTATDEGRAAVFRDSPEPPKVSRSARRYEKWLAVSEVYCLSFGEFLRRKLYEGARP